MCLRVSVYFKQISSAETQFEEKKKKTAVWNSPQEVNALPTADILLPCVWTLRSHSQRAHPHFGYARSFCEVPLLN